MSSLKENNPAEYYAMYYWLGRLGRSQKNVFAELMSFFSCLEEAWRTPCSSLRNICFGPDVSDERFYDKRLRQEALSVCTKAIEKGQILVCTEDEDYPLLLKEYSVKPYLLFTRGDIKKLNKTGNPLGVVGSRSCTPYGKAVTYNFCKSFSQYDFAIISGLARGIDSIAHKAALGNGIFTAAVLGCGVDVPYPVENTGLYRQIAEQGVIISEYPPGTQPFKSHFPARNRIIAGMSKGILVCEAGLGSGALITAQLAVDDGRDVFAVPSQIDSASGSGCNALIKNGASCVTSYKDILQAFNIDTQNSAASEIDISSLNSEEKIVFFYIYNNCGNCDTVINATGLDAASARRILTTLEINGFIKCRSDGVYYTNKPS